MMLRRQKLHPIVLFFCIILLLWCICYWSFLSIVDQQAPANTPTEIELSKDDEPEIDDDISTELRDTCEILGSLKDNDPKLVACLKEKYLFPPSHLPYNLENPNIENPTQHGQNVIALKLLRFKKNGFFIECGALNGELYSNSLYLERKFGWSGLLIEAESNTFKDMMLKHRKAWTSPTCLSPKFTAEKLILSGLDYNIGRGLTLMKSSENVPLRDFPGFLDAKNPPAEVQCFPLYTYLLALNRTVVDYFSLDVEGADFEVLKTIPFDKIIFKVLEVEVHWVKEGPQAVKTFLEERGYIFVKEIVVDYIFVHKSVKLPKNLKI